jgi:hypothetical protein
MEIKVDYDGEYPTLCSGKLIVNIDGKQWDFPEDCMVSGGSVYMDGDDYNTQVEDGPWKIGEWPDGFPENLKPDVLDVVNDTVEWGCCGGCI